MTPVLLITGGSRGIGAATARLAAQAGYAVGLSYRQEVGAAAEVVRAIQAADGRALFIDAAQHSVAIQCSTPTVIAARHDVAAPTVDVYQRARHVVLTHEYDFQFAAVGAAGIAAHGGLGSCNVVGPCSDYFDGVIPVGGVFRWHG